MRTEADVKDPIWIFCTVAITNAIALLRASCIMHNARAGGGKEDAEEGRKGPVATAPKKRVSGGVPAAAPMRKAARRQAAEDTTAAPQAIAATSAGAQRAMGLGLVGRGRVRNCNCCGNAPRALLRIARWSSKSSRQDLCRRPRSEGDINLAWRFR